mmetsp:Transcript_32317/g.108883  ORF Transcript_32317/g.108883 Transcript_32317/m.108883 type:complete len:222 (+) Transcript_32317:424-1089(+)
MGQYAGEKSRPGPSERTSLASGLECAVLRLAASKNEDTAPRGDSTIGSLRFVLNDVLITIPRRVFRLTASSSKRYRAGVEPTVCGRAVPSTWAQPGTCAASESRQTRLMYGVLPESNGAEKSKAASSCSSDGASGRKSSRCLTISLIASTIRGSEADATIDRWPSALGPNSLRPSNQKTAPFPPSTTAAHASKTASSSPETPTGKSHSWNSSIAIWWSNSS